MYLNLVQFLELQKIEEFSKKLKDTVVIVAKDFSLNELTKFNQKKRKSSVKLLSCKIFEKKNNKELQSFRGKADFLGVRGGSIEMNSWAANQKIDLLLQPFSSSKNCFDLATANVLKENNIFVGFLFNEFLNANGFKQTQLMKNAILALKLLGKAKVNVLFFSGAENEFEMRSAKDLGSFGVFLGMNKQSCVSCKKNSEKLLERVK